MLLEWVCRMSDLRGAFIGHPAEKGVNPVSRILPRVNGLTKTFRSLIKSQMVGIQATSVCPSEFAIEAILV